jgi:hypothetical protein
VPRRPIASLELLDWRAMPLPSLLLMLAGLAAVALFGPALVVLLLATASLCLSELALATVLLGPSARLLFRAEMPLPSQPLLQPVGSPTQRLLPGRKARRRGVVRALSGERVALQVRARDRRGTYLWRVTASEFELVCDGGIVRVCGCLKLEGRGSDDLPLELPPVEAPGWKEGLVLRDGDEVEARGPLGREQAAAGYRDAAEVEVMRGVPGNPVTIVLDRRRGPA